MKVIIINNKEYQLFSQNEDRNNIYPHMLDLETGETPSNQRGMLKEFLLQNNIDVEPWEKKNTHWCVQQAIKLSNAKSITFEDVEAEKNVENEYLQLTIQNIEEQEKLVAESPNYGKEDLLVREVVKKFPGHEDVSVIAMKISVIDVTNSTQLSKYKSSISLYDLALLIFNMHNIDERMRNGDPTVVEEIARNSKEKYGINLFSFASKYCHAHNYHLYAKDDYSKYDNVVKETLPHYFNIKENDIEKWRVSFNYKDYNDFIGKSLDTHNIKIDFRRTKFDHFLWYANRTK